MARNPLVHAMLRSRDPRQRQLGRQLARGRTRHLSLELQAAIDAADAVAKAYAARVRKDGAGPATGSPVTGADVYTPNAGRGERRRRMYEA